MPFRSAKDRPKSKTEPFPDIGRAICASGRLMFQIIGAMAEFERALIQERVRAGIRNARAKGRRLGRPSKYIDTSAIEALRSKGASWREIAAKLSVGLGTVYRMRRLSGQTKTGVIDVTD